MVSDYTPPPTTQATLKGAPYVTVSPVGLAQGYPKNNNANYGPDTPGTTTCGIQEAINTGLKVRLLVGVFFMTSPLTISTIGQVLEGAGSGSPTNQSVITSNLGSPNSTITVSARAVTLRDFTTNSYGAGATGLNIQGDSVLCYGLTFYETIGVQILGTQSNFFGCAWINNTTCLYIGTDGNGCRVIGGEMNTNAANSVLVDVEGGDTCTVMGVSLGGTATSTILKLNHADSLCHFIGNRIEGANYVIDFVSNKGDYIVGNEYASVTGFFTGTPEVVGLTVKDNYPFNPQGFAITTPEVGASTVDVQNTNPFPVRIYLLTGGTGTAFQITDPSGTAQAITVTLAAGMEFTLDPGAKIQFTYTAAPTWKWYGV